MAVDSNGKLAEPGKKRMNGHAKAPKPKPTKPKGFGILGAISRLLTWYSIITILLRCPATNDLVTDSSPKICKPYFQLRSVIAPHLEPYYDEYAAPYVSAARPYYDTLDRGIITPATALGKKYGAPRVNQARAFGLAQWRKNIQPQVSKYQGLLKAQYDDTLGPHVSAAVAATSPYYDVAKTNALQTYYEHILPTYTLIQPYASQGYEITSKFVVGTAVPYTKWAWTTGVVFLDRTVWPKVRILYGENVEPQLVRIGERLGRYRDGKKLKTVVNEINSSSSASITSPTASTTFLSVSGTISSVSESAQTTLASREATIPSSEVPDATPESEIDIREKARKIVAHDLKTWQEKFTKAANEGSDDLEERITEITERIIKNQAQSVGGALIIQLEETVKSSFSSLKSSIISIVKGSKDIEDSEEALAAAVRKAGVAIKEKAQAVRIWRQNYDSETNSLISKSAEDTLEILDHIRDLGLQEIGMRWAWTDGVTHKDWSKYHQLKTKFDEWRYDVEKVATEHPGLAKARAASEEVESQAMDIAEDAAKELSRLKETGRWKISAVDSSNDFSTKYMPPAAAVAGKKIKGQVSELSEAMGASSQGTVESIVSAANSGACSLAESVAGTSLGQVESLVSSISSLSDMASSLIIGTSQGTIESVSSEVKASASSIIDHVSSSIIRASKAAVESIISPASQSAGSLSKKASSSIIGEEPGVAEKATNSMKLAASVISMSASTFSDIASSSLSSGSTEISETVSQASSAYRSLTSSLADSLSKSATDGSSSVSSAASSESSTASKKVFGGAMAQFVEAKQIIFEDVVEDSDEETFSEKVLSMASEAGDRYSDVTKAVSEALMGTATSPDFPITKLAAEKYSSALSAASVALYGTDQGTGESISSVASSRYSDAVAAASSIIYGAPMPITDSIAAQATSVYNAGLSRAKEQYSHARCLVSAQISGQPKPIHEEMLTSVENAYSDSLEAASSRLKSALSAASNAIHSTPTPTHQFILKSMSSIAESRLSEGLSAASAQFSSAKSYVGAVNSPAPQKQKLLGQMQDQYYAGVGMAHARYSEFLEAASSAVMPIPTPFLSKASVSIVNTPAHKFHAALATASKHYSEAIKSASSQLDQILASIPSIGREHKDAIPTARLASVASSRYRAAISEASSSYFSIQAVITQQMQAGASAVSSGVIGSKTPWAESIASGASENWEALITKASSQIYGAPTPYFVTRKLLSEAREYATQASDGAAAQYSAVQSLVSELVSGKEPDFTESVYNRLSSAYYAGAAQVASSASSYASEAYISASSIASAVFTPPPTLEVILDSAASRLNDAVDAASIQIYGTSKGAYEEATSSASSAYSSISSVVSEQIYGSTTSYIEAAQSSITDAASSAQTALSKALYGTAIGKHESLTNGAGEAYASATSVIAEHVSAATSMVGENYSSAQAVVSDAIYGPEKGALESAQSRLYAAVESARVKLSQFAVEAGDGAQAAVSQASEGVENFASSVSSVVSEATGRVRDEL